MSKKESTPSAGVPTLQITKIKISDKDIVTIEATETIDVHPGGDAEAPSQQHTNFHSITSSFPPSKEFLEAFQKLKRYAMPLVEFSRKDIPLVNSMTVGEMRIAGEQHLENSRVEFVLMKWVKRTGKGVPIRTGQAVMYGEKGKSDIPETVEMTKQIDAVIAEGWEYIGGKNGAGAKIQLAFAFKRSA
jgi:hypothetical protein